MPCSPGGQHLARSGARSVAPGSSRGTLVNGDPGLARNIAEAPGPEQQCFKNSSKTLLLVYNRSGPIGTSPVYGRPGSRAGLEGPASDSGMFGYFGNLGLGEVPRMKENLVC